MIRPRQSAEVPGDASRSKDLANAMLSAYAALLQADRWVFQARESVNGAGLVAESAALDGIRRSIARSLDRQQPQAYRAMKQSAASKLN